MQADKQEIMDSIREKTICYFTPEKEKKALTVEERMKRIKENSSPLIDEAREWLLDVGGNNKEREMEDKKKTTRVTITTMGEFKMLYQYNLKDAIEFIEHVLAEMKEDNTMEIDMKIWIK